MSLPSLDYVMQILLFVSLMSYLLFNGNLFVIMAVSFAKMTNFLFESHHIVRIVVIWTAMLFDLIKGGITFIIYILIFLYVFHIFYLNSIDHYSKPVPFYEWLRSTLIFEN